MICVLHSCSVFFSLLSHPFLFPLLSQRNRVDLLLCIQLGGKFDPRVGIDFVAKFMKYFAKFVLYPLVRPFVLLFFCLTLTMSVILMFRLQIGLNQNLALPKVYIYNTTTFTFIVTLYTPCDHFRTLLLAVVYLPCRIQYRPLDHLYNYIIILIPYFATYWCISQL